LEFPKRIYTAEEVKKAGELVKKGYKHRLRVKGSLIFKQKLKQALKLVKTAGYYIFLRTYIRSVVEIDGLTNSVRQTQQSGQINTLCKTQWTPPVSSYKKQII
jgi:hypothetical protein